MLPVGGVSRTMTVCGATESILIILLISYII